MKITTSKGDQFEASMITNATWNHSVIVGFESELEKLSEIADKFEGLTYINTEKGEIFYVDILTDATMVSDHVYQVRLTRGEEQN